MMFSMFGLSIKKGIIKTEETEVSITADNQLYYYQKSNKPKEPNGIPIKNISIPKRQFEDINRIPEV